MYARQDIKIKTKIKNPNENDINKINDYLKPVIDFVKKYNVEFSYSFTIDGDLYCQYEVEGLTTSYCRGIVAEIKEMLKNTFNCKIEVLLNAY